MDILAEQNVRYAIKSTSEAKIKRKKRGLGGIIGGIIILIKIKKA
jgi:hypothetical protein